MLTLRRKLVLLLPKLLVGFVLAFAVSVISAFYLSCKVKSKRSLCLSIKIKYRANLEFSLIIAWCMFFTFFFLEISRFYHQAVRIQMHRRILPDTERCSVLSTKLNRSHRAPPGSVFLCLLCVMLSFDLEWWIEDTVHWTPIPQSMYTLTADCIRSKGCVPPTANCLCVTLNQRE